MVSLFQFNASKIPQMLLEILINMLSGEGQMSPIKFDLKLCGANYKHKTLTQTDRTNKTINFYSPKKEQRNKKSKAEIQVDMGENREWEMGNGGSVSRLALQMMLIYGFRFDYSGVNCK